MEETVPRKRRAVPIADLAEAASARKTSPMSNFFQDVAAKAANLQKKEGAQQFTKRSVVSFHLGLPSPSLALSYGMGSNVIPFSRVMHLAGKEASFKTAFMIDMIRLMLELAESVPEVPLVPEQIHYNENENKLASDYIWSILEHRDQYEGVIRLDETKTADEWIQGMKDKTAVWESLFGPSPSKPDKTYDHPVGWFTPLVLAVDSLCGTATESEFLKAEKSGSIDMMYPDLAKKLTQLSKFIPRMIGSRPMLFIATNHVKTFTNAMTGMMEDKVPGSQAFKHAESLEFRFSRVKSIDHETLPGALVKIKFHKNCFGDSKRQIEVPIRWTYDMDENGSKRQWSMWDWPVASIDLLEAIRAKRPKLWEKIEPVLDLNISQGRVWSNALGIPKTERVTKHEAGILLEQNAVVLDELLPIMGIKQGRFFKPGMNYVTERLNAEASFDSMSERVYRRPAAGDLSQFLSSNEDTVSGSGSGFVFDSE